MTRIDLSVGGFQKNMGSNADIATKKVTLNGDDGVVHPLSAYPNNLYCTFEVQTRDIRSFVAFDIMYDLEPTHDLLWVQIGVDQPYAVLTGVDFNLGKVVVPTDENGIASLLLTTDSLGRRTGFYATAQAQGQSPTPPGGCPDGYSGLNCEFPYCISQNAISQNTRVDGISSSYVVGRIVSQSPSFSVRPMPWAKGDGCRWEIPLDGAPTKTTALRLVFNEDFDLEPFPLASVGDKLIIQNDAASDKLELFVEECTSDEVCSLSWQVRITTHFVSVFFRLFSVVEDRF